MSLTQAEANKIADALKGEFNQYATIRAVGKLGGVYQVQVEHSKNEAETVLRNMQQRANDAAGRTLTRSELEFKTGTITF